MQLSSLWIPTTLRGINPPSLNIYEKCHKKSTKIKSYCFWIRIEEAKEELMAIMNHDLIRNSCLLVYANKQDLQDSMTTSQVVEKLELTKLLRNRPWHVQGAVATSGQGLYEGLDWLAATLSAMPSNQRVI